MMHNNMVETRLYHGRDTSGFLPYYTHFGVYITYAIQADLYHLAHIRVRV